MENTGKIGGGAPAAGDIGVDPTGGGGAPAAGDIGVDPTGGGGAPAADGGGCIKV